MHILDKRLKANWRRYLFQCLLAFLALTAILYFLDILTHAAIVAALGASAFIIFAMPKSVTAQPRKVIGGHIMGLIAGSICYFAFLYSPLENGATEEFLYIIAAALSVGLAILLMLITDTGHPPAAATALGIVAYEPLLAWPLWMVALFVLIFAVVLSLARFLLRPWLRELV